LLKAKDSTNNGESFLWGEIFKASSKKISYLDFGTTSIKNLIAEKS
jgi:hypothetical protein